MTVASTHSGWIYAATDDPGQGLLKLTSVVRSDGRALDSNNFWIQQYLDKDYHQKFSVNILDSRLNVNDPATYRLVYENPPLDTIPPVTTLVFDDPYILEDTATTHTVYMLPGKNVMFTATDNQGGTGVQNMMKRFDNETSFSDAYPFTISATGTHTHTLDYYSVDNAGIKEDTKTEKIVIDGGAPVIGGLTAADFSPGAPAGIAAVRTSAITLNVTDDVDRLPVTFDIAKGEGSDFAALTKVRTITATATSGTALIVNWDGKADDGTLMPTGRYTVRASVTDGLGTSATDKDHSTSRTAAFGITDWFKGAAVDSTTAEQMYPKVSGTKAVWQDKRSGNWQVRMKDLSFANASSIAVSYGAANAERPSLDGNTVAWQEQQGSDGVYRVRFSNARTTAYINPAADTEFPNRSEEHPTVSGKWLAWQDNRGGNWDIYARDLSDGTNTVRQITSHERDQVNPVISNGVLYWEDYRFGPAEIYSYDLTSGIETRVTNNSFDQTNPAVSGDNKVWTDQRDGGRNIYSKQGVYNETRVSYTAGDKDQASVHGSTIVYRDFANGPDDPNLSFYDLSIGVGGILTDNPARQEQPSVGDGYILWQDDRDNGVHQIYAAPFNIEPVPVEVTINKGYNLIAAGSLLANTYPTAVALINNDGVRAGLAVDRVMIYDALHGSPLEAVDGQTAGNDFTITQGSGIVLYAGKAGSLKVADSGESVAYTLLPGMNQIGILKAPYGYHSYDMMNSIGLDNIQGVRRFNPETGGWETASVRTKNGAKEIVGVNFPVKPGDGLIVTMKLRVDTWLP
jgi:beta propeller repeat protein